MNDDYGHPVPPCAGQWVLFDSIDVNDHEVARKICDTCPIIDNCRTLLDQQKQSHKAGGAQPVGTWAGGLYGTPFKPLVPHGTMQAYYRHKYHKEDVCGPCDEARRIHAAAYHKQRKAKAS
jgi:hypothetical protein